jgi:hypothetical protein
MMSVYGAKTKKDLKGFIGRAGDEIFQETSFFGPEYKGDGRYTVVGPSPHVRKWFATVEIKDGKVNKVT